MAECQSSGVQGLPRGGSFDQRCLAAPCPGDPAAAATGVHRVAHHRMPQVLQVHPDLVGAAGVQLELAGDRPPSNRAITVASVRAARPGGRNHHSLAVLRVPRDRRLDPDVGWHRGGPRPARRRCAAPVARRWRRPSLRWARSVLATIMSPEVSRSSRCTMPGRPAAPPDSVVPRATSALTRVSSQWPGAG